VGGKVLLPLWSHLIISFRWENETRNFII